MCACGSGADESGEAGRFQLFRALFEQAPDGIVLTDDDDTILDVNGIICELSGARRDELIGKSALVLADPDYDPTSARAQRSARGGRIRETVPYKRADGTRGWWEYTFMEAIQSGVNASFVRDVTEREEAREKLQRANETLQGVLRASPVAIDVLDLDGRVEMWNPAAEALFGTSSGEMVGRHPKVSDPEAFDRGLAEVRAGGAFTGRPVRGACPVRGELEISASRAPLCNADGAVIGSVGIYVDLTEHRRLEAQLLQAQKMEAIGRLVGGIVHDFNNVLAAIAGFSSGLVDALGSEGQVGEDLGEIVSATERAAVLTRKLAAFSRKQSLARESIEIDRVVRGVERMLRRLLGEDIDLAVILGADGASIFGDTGQLEQVLVNLAVNARDAMPRGGTLAIETRITRGGDPAWIELCVRDTGVGMDEEARARAFDPFFTTKPVGEGSGLGLSTVYGIVTQSDGTIALDSTPGGGTAVTIAWPRQKPHGEPILRVRAPRDSVHRAVARDTEPAPIEGIEADAATIFVVEDDDIVRRVVGRMLKKRGYRILAASSGEEALARCRDEGLRIDVLLTDVVMPGMGGPELAQRVLELSPAVQIIYMSGYVDQRVTGAGAVQHACAYIEKPFEPDELCDVVEGALADRDGVSR